MAETFQLLGATPLDGICGPIGGRSDAGIVITERRHLGKLILRGEPNDRAFLNGAAKALDTSPPLEPNTTRTSKQAYIVWTAPNEWLLVTSPGKEIALEKKLSDVLSNTHHAVTNTTDHSTVISLSGRNAQTVMAKGCAIDLHRRVFMPGSAAQSQLAKTLVTFWQTDDIPTYEILVRASFASYLWSWIIDAGAEFGVRIEA